MGENESRMIILSILICIEAVVSVLIFQLVFQQKADQLLIRTDKVELNSNFPIQFNIQNDCPYQGYLIPSNLHIDFNVDSYSTTGISISFYKEWENNEYMKRVNTCFARPGNSCVLSVQSKGEAEFLVVNADKINESDSQTFAKFFWRCELEYPFMPPTNISIFIYIVLLLTIPLMYLHHTATGNRIKKKHQG